MINNIEIKNFKSIKHLNQNLKNLNLLAGLNGSGKSSFIQSLLVLKQSYQLSRGQLTLNNPDFVEIGKGKDAYYQYANEEFIMFNFKINSEYSYLWKFDYQADAEILQTNNIYSPKELEKINLFKNNFQYLNAERIGPRITYKTNFGVVNNLRQLGKYGEFTTQFLESFGSMKVKFDDLKHPKAKSDTLLHQAEAWLGEITPGTKMNVTAIPNTELVLLDFQFETNIFKPSGSLTNRFRPSNVGFGLSYILPVIVSLLTADNQKLIIIENPEAHIHPRGQSELGKLISKAAKIGAQIFIETHSDHILNGIRVGVKNNLISKNDVNIMFFEMNSENDEHYTKLSNIKVDSNGELSNYPPNFLDEWSNQLLKLI